MKKFTIFAVLIFAIILAGCAAPADPQPNDQGYTNISVETLQTMIDERRDTFLLVNTHIPFEADIPNTDLTIPFNEITNNLDKLPEDKGAEIVLYCRSDNMSHAAAADLVDAGYTNVKNLVGGFNAWKDAGLPLDTEP